MLAFRGDAAERVESSLVVTDDAVNFPKTYETPPKHHWKQASM